MTIDLTTPHGCNDEIQRCSQGLAALDHLFNAAVDAKSDAEGAWEDVEAEAARAAREDPTQAKALTATEIKGRITDWVNTRPAKSKIREELREATNRLDKIERFMRSLEKRLSGAQSALSGHGNLGRYGG